MAAEEEPGGPKRVTLQLEPAQVNSITRNQEHLPLVGQRSISRVVAALIRYADENDIWQEALKNG